MSSNKKDIVLQYTVKDGANTETINAITKTSSQIYI